MLNPYKVDGWVASWIYKERVNIFTNEHKQDEFIKLSWMVGGVDVG